MDNKTDWNGKGYPPIGTKCEWLDSNNDWMEVGVSFSSGYVIVVTSEGLHEMVDFAIDLVDGPGERPQFRPIKTPADKEREDAITGITHLLIFTTNQVSEYAQAEKIYDAGYRLPVERGEVISGEVFMGEYMEGPKSMKAHVEDYIIQRKE